MSITVRETAKGITIRTTGADALQLLAHLSGPACTSAQAAPLQAGVPRTGVVATNVNMRVRTKVQGAS